MGRLDALDLGLKLNREEEARRLTIAQARLLQLRLVLGGLTGPGEIGPPVLPPFQKERQVICSSFSVSLSLLRSSSLLTPTRAKGLPASRFTSDRSCGYMARQGGHQLPQKSSTTTLPR